MTAAADEVSEWEPRREWCMKEFDFDLPADLIAQKPAEPRDRSRLMVVDRQRGTWEHRVFAELPDLLDPRDILVRNDTRVVPARLVGHREVTGGRWEGLFLKRIRRRNLGDPGEDSGPARDRRVRGRRPGASPDAGGSRRGRPMDRPATARPGFERHVGNGPIDPGAARTDPPAPLYPPRRRRARRSARLSDGLCPTARLGRGADGRTPLHARGLRPARRTRDRLRRT